MKIVEMRNKDNEKVLPDFIEQELSNSKIKVPSSYAVNEAFNKLMNDTLWVNPNPESSFSPTNITFENISKYSYYEILYKSAGDKNFHFSTGKVPIDKQTILYAPVGGSLYYRECGQIVNNTMYIANAYINGNLSSPNNMALIPYKILGHYK